MYKICTRASSELFLITKNYCKMWCGFVRIRIAVIAMADILIHVALHHWIIGQTKSASSDGSVYQITYRRAWIFYQSIGDLALLTLVPLLAIAAWFLLIRGGSIDKYVVATVSFTVGLVTNRIVTYLIGFTSSMFKSGDSSKPISK
jgi:hypothetical protein